MNDENNNTTTIDAKIESKSNNDINNNDVVVDNVEKSIVTSIFDIIDKEHQWDQYYYHKQALKAQQENLMWSSYYIFMPAVQCVVQFLI